MSNWKQVRELVQFSIKGITPKYVEKSAIMVLNQKCVRNNKIDFSLAQYTNDSKGVSENKIIRIGDILMNSTGQGTAGRCAFVDKIPDGIILIPDSHILILRCKSYNEARCLNYNLFYSETFIQSFMDGSTGQGELDKIRLFNLSVPIPINELTQQKIASVLSNLDAKIELNNRINAELEAMAKTLYDYWFVQFDFPDAEGKPYKSSGGEMVWSEGLKREIPQGWEVKELKSIANFTTGKLDSNAEDIRGNYLFFTCASEPTYTNMYAFDDTVILIAGNNASGNFHINRYKGKFNAYQRTYIITAKNQKSLELIYQILKVETKLLKSKGNGSQTKFLTIGMLTDIKVAFEEDIVELLFNMINPIYQKQEIIRQENQQLSALRDWLLPMLMNGQVVVE